MFVFTDGYGTRAPRVSKRQDNSSSFFRSGSSGLQLTHALKLADEANIEVRGIRLGKLASSWLGVSVSSAGIGVGYDRLLVPVVYKNWIVAALPRLLPDAFRAAYQADAQARPCLSVLSFTESCV